VEFAVDTGSPFTILSQKDATKLNIPYKRLSKHDRSIVIASFAGLPYLLEEVELVPYRSGGHVEKLERVFVLPPPDELGREIPMPSILGRDFLTRFTLVFEKGQGRILFTDEPILGETAFAAGTSGAITE